MIIIHSINRKIIGMLKFEQNKIINLFKNKFLTIFLILIISFTFFSCSQEKNYNAQLKGNTMGTYYIIKVVNVPPKLKIKKIEKEVKDTLSKVNKILSNWDKQNDRVDKIATNYSKGIPILSNSKKTASSVDFSEKNAPLEIQELFSRNELIEKFAEKNYLLNSLELRKLLGEENQSKINKYLPFEWRNWRLIPKNKKYWIIEKKEF